MQEKLTLTGSSTVCQWRRKQFESGGAQFPARSAGKIFFTVPHHFFMVPPHMTGHYREVQGTVTRT